MIDPTQTNFAFSDLTPPTLYPTDIRNSLATMIPSSFPEAQSLQSKPVQLLELNEEQLKKEWEELHQSHPHIESTIDYLQNSGQKQTLVFSALVAKYYFYEYGKIGNECTKKVINLLEQVLPVHVTSHPTIKNYFEKSYITFHSIGALLEGFDAGLAGVILIARYRLLKEAKTALNLLKSELKKPKHENQEEWERLAKEWEINIEIEEKELRYEATRYGICSAKQIVGNIQVIGQFFPVGVSTISSTILQGFGWIAGGLLVILSAFSLKKQIDNQNLLNGWVDEFKKFQSNGYAIPTESLRNRYEASFANTPDGKILDENIKENLFGQYIQREEAKLPKEETLAYKSQQLLLKRKERSEKQIKTLQADEIAKKTHLQQFKYNTFYSKLSHLQGETFNQALDSLLQRLKKDEQVTFKSQLDHLNSVADKKAIFHQWIQQNNPLVQCLIDLYFEGKTEEELIQLSTEQQQTLSVALKGALRLLIQKKHQVEQKYANFKLIESKTLLVFLTITFSISLTVSILGCFFFPAGGLLLLILSLSLGGISLGLTVGFAIGSFYLSYQKNPSLWKNGLTSKNIKAKLKKIRLGMQEISRNTKWKKLVATAHIAQQLSLQLHDNHSDSKESYQKSKEAYLKARQSYLDQCRAIEHSNQQLQLLHEELLSKHWEDFSKHAGLSSPSDSLTILEESLKALDLNLIDEELRYVLETQLGFDLATLQKEIAKDPQLWKKSLQKFFSFEDADLIYLIRRQRARQEKKLIPILTELKV